MNTFRTTVLMVLIMMGTIAKAQDEAKVEANIGADVVSRYIWRGQDCGYAAVQPTLGVSYKGLSLSAWGSYGIANTDDTEELDLTLAYSTGGLTVGITDYWFGNGDTRYFLYDSHKTAHVFEANVGYDFGCLSLNWFTNFAGNDGLNKDGKRAYSSYFELAAPFTIGSLDCVASAGAVPYATSYYADATGFAVTNLSLNVSKEFALSNSLKMPVFAQLSANPSTQKMYLVFGVGIHY